MSCVRFWPRDNGTFHILTGDEDGLVHIWDAKSRRKVFSCSRPEGSAKSGVVALHALKNRWVVQRQFGRIEVASEEGTESELLTSCAGFAKCSILDDTLSSGGDCVEVWDLRTRNKVCSLKREGGGMALDTRLLRDSAGRLHLVSAYEDGCIRIFDVSAQADVGISLSAIDGVCLSIDMIAANKKQTKWKGIAAGASPCIAAFAVDLSTHKATVVREFSVEGAKGVSEVRWCGKGSVVAGCWDSRAYVFDGNTFTKKGVLCGHSSSVRSVDYARLPYPCIATASDDGNVALHTLPIVGSIANK